MRLVVGVLAFIGVGAVSLAVADPPSSSRDAPAAAAPAPAAPTPSATQPAVDPNEKWALSEGYKPEMRNGEKVFCRREQPLGSRLGQEKHCATLEQLKISRQESRDVMDKIQRSQKNPQG